MADEAYELGFLTVLGTVRTGLVGGFLILDRLGHPVEFHCTAPIRANRAQEILYGAALEPFLFGERIASALLKKGRTPCVAVMTDQSGVASIQERLAFPLIRWSAKVHGEGGGPKTHPVAERELSAEWKTFPRPKGTITIPTRFLDNGQLPTKIATTLDLFDGRIDPSEPFERIVLAIAESQKGG